jgi:hypothetical protein
MALTVLILERREFFAAWFVGNLNSARPRNASDEQVFGT